ncbi:hypothetical protein C8J57DRAFT_1245159 [Mycena rebaudengoi]|nr:hypothetical protein C8J57DRAFT_1245159 [Mycena rebaudengoi]
MQNTHLLYDLLAQGLYTVPMRVWLPTTVSLPNTVTTALALALGLPTFCSFQGSFVPQCNLTETATRLTCWSLNQSSPGYLACESPLNKVQTLWPTRRSNAVALSFPAFHPSTPSDCSNDHEPTLPQLSQLALLQIQLFKSASLTYSLRSYMQVRRFEAQQLHLGISRYGVALSGFRQAADNNNVLHNYATHKFTAKQKRVNVRWAVGVWRKADWGVTGMGLRCAPALSTHPLPKHCEAVDRQVVNARGRLELM